jgi:hypothetical protein
MAALPKVVLTIGMLPPLVSTAVLKSKFIRPAVVRLGCVPRLMAIQFLDTNFSTLLTLTVTITHGYLPMAGKFVTVVNCNRLYVQYVLHLTSRS